MTAISPKLVSTESTKIDEKLKALFIQTLAIKEEDFSNSLAPEGVAGWDSLGHLKLVAALQQAFGVELEVDEIMRMEDVGTIKQILKDRGVQF